MDKELTQDSYCVEETEDQATVEVKLEVFSWPHLTTLCCYHGVLDIKSYRGIPLLFLDSQRIAYLQQR